MIPDSEDDYTNDDNDNDDFEVDPLDHVIGDKDENDQVSDSGEAIENEGMKKICSMVAGGEELSDQDRYRWKRDPDWDNLPEAITILSKEARNILPKIGKCRPSLEH